MDTKVVSALAHGPAADVAQALLLAARRDLAGATASLVFVFASTAQPLSELMPTLRAGFPGATLLGASTAGEFTQAGDAKGATALLAVAGDFKIFAGIGTGLKADVEGAVGRAVADLPATVEGYPHRTALLLLDPLAGNGEEATLLTSALLGGEVRLAGGAAGDDLHMKETHVALGDRTATDAVVVAVVFSTKPLGVGVCHGHVPMSTPRRVTRAEGNVVHELDGRPAWDVWIEATRAATDAMGIRPEDLPPDEVISYLLRYEAGLSSGDEVKIRAPLARVAGGAISFACGIPQGSVLRITESIPSRQVDSARTAARRARAQIGDAPIAGAVVFDCICRNLILKDAFGTAVSAISDELGGVPLAGFETYGEIALDAGDMSGFHNTTTVVLGFPR